MGTLLVRVCGADAGRAAAICSESSFRRRPAYWVTSVWGTWEATPKRLSTEWFKLRLYRFNALRPFPLPIATSAAVLAFPKLPSFCICCAIPFSRHREQSFIRNLLCTAFRLAKLTATPVFGVNLNLTPIGYFLDCFFRTSSPAAGATG